MYLFHVHTHLPSWRIVLRDDRLLAEATALGPWTPSVAREAADVNPDVRQLVDDWGYCLFRVGRTLAELALELGAASDSHAEAPSAPAPAQPGSAPYRFHVHRRLSGWRLVLKGDAVPDDMRADEWRFTRARSVQDTASDTRSEIETRGYSLFRIGYRLEDLAADLQAARGT
jgi:hypothetical protein